MITDYRKCSKLDTRNGFY